MPVITTVGAQLIAAAIGNGPLLDIDRFVLANVPGLDHTQTPPADEVLPDAAHIVVDRAPTKAGYVDDNRVAYSMMLTADEGDFDFNWLGLVSGSQLVMVAWIPTASKFKTVGTTSGNVISRNMVIKCEGVKAATPISAPAESWMFDFSGLMAELALKIQRNQHSLRRNPVAPICNGISQRDMLVFDAGQSETITIAGNSLQSGDVVEVHKQNAAGRLDITNSDGVIHLPDGTAEANHWLDGRRAVLHFIKTGDGRVTFSGGY